VIGWSMAEIAAMDWRDFLDEVAEAQRIDDAEREMEAMRWRILLRR